MPLSLRLPGWAAPWRKRGVVVPALRLSGVIGSLPLRGAGLTLQGLERQIEALFAPKDAPAAVLILNSPGGSPVQSSLIGQRIRALAEQKRRPVYAFVEDVAASGGYWLACAADEIHADPSSIVGSIGVVSSGFGFHDAIARLGVERRVHTTGERKAILDPFRPERPEDLALLREIQGDILGRFVAWVRERRGARLKEEGETLFDGRIWTGERALALGLIDGLGEPRAFVRARFGPDAKLRVLEPRRGWLARRLRFGGPDVAARLVAGAIGAVEERAMWARYGL
jgi:serine protease SohB